MQAMGTKTILSRDEADPERDSRLLIAYGFVAAVGALLVAYFVHVYLTLNATCDQPPPGCSPFQGSASPLPIFLSAVILAVGMFGIATTVARRGRHRRAVIGNT